MSAELTLGEMIKALDDYNTDLSLDTRNDISEMLRHIISRPALAWVIEMDKKSQIDNARNIISISSESEKPSTFKATLNGVEIDGIESCEVLEFSNDKYIKAKMTVLVSLGGK